jgi:hypothetical protein
VLHRGETFSLCKVSVHLVLMRKIEGERTMHLLQAQRWVAPFPEQINERVERDATFSYSVDTLYILYVVLLPMFAGGAYVPTAQGISLRWGKRAESGEESFGCPPQPRKGELA